MGIKLFFRSLFQKKRLQAFAQHTSQPQSVKNLSEGNSQDSAYSPAIADEMNSGRVPPYGFEAAILVIKDINTKSKLINEISFQEFLDIYRGKISKLTENSIEIIFKLQPDEDCRLLAFALNRDLEKTGKLKNLISCLHFGEVYFHDKDQPEFLGSCLESVRSFIDNSKISEGFYFHATLKDHFSSLCFFDNHKEYCKVKKYTSILELLETYMPLEAASYFRNSDDLAHTLNYLSEKIVENDFSEIKDAFYFLKRFKIEQTSPSLLNSYKSLLNLLLRMYKQNQDMKHLLSSCISAAPHLISNTSFDDELKELLNWCLAFRDLRVKANTIEALGYFDPEFPTINEHSNSKFNRIAAEAMLVQGRKELDQVMTDKILSFLNSANPYFVSSGLYLISSLCEYHFYKDYSYFSKNPNFNKLMERVLVFKDHPHSMIRIRAQSTLKILETLKGAA